MGEGMRGGSDTAVLAWLGRSDDPGRTPAPEQPHAALSPEAPPPVPADPRAEVWYGAAELAAQRLAQAPSERHRDLYEVLGRNASRYLYFSRKRLAALFTSLSEREREVLASIPFLLHVNDPGLPGYAGAGTPHGLRHYEPPRQVGPVAARPAFRALLCVGGAGTLAGKAGSVELWAVVDEAGLSGPERERLARKMTSIETWAHHRGAGLRLRAVDAARVRQNDFAAVGSPPSDGAGPPGRIAKEALYRESIHLAGELPLWWVAPVGVDAGEYRRLSERVAAGLPPGTLGFVDLGFIGEPTRGELLRATLWQIERCLREPFDALLRLALLDRYLDDERPRLLCDLLKKRVFEAAMPTTLLDPAAMLFDAVAEHLAGRGDWRAFRLAQRCFYLKIGLRLSHDAPERARFLERFEVMRAYVSRWGWNDEVLRDLDALDRWSPERVDRLAADVQRWLLDLFRRLADRVRDEGLPVGEDEIAVAGRRLYAVFAAEPGRVRRLFTTFLREPRAEDRLVLLEVPTAPASRRWEIHRQVRRDQAVSRADALGAASSLAEAAAWLALNRLFGRHTVVGLVASETEATLSDLRGLIERFTALLDAPDPLSLPAPTLRDAACIARLALVVNFESGAASRGQRVHDVALVTLDTWGVVRCLRHEGPAALPSALGALFRRLAVAERPPEPPVVVVPQGRDAQSLRARVLTLVDRMGRIALQRDRGDRALVTEVGGHFQVYLRQGERTRMVGGPRLDTVLRALGRLGPRPLSIEVDPHSPALRGIGALIARHAADRDTDVYVGWTAERDRAAVVVHDELGRMLYQPVQPGQLSRVLVRTLRRIAFHLRERARTTGELRRHLKVCEWRAGRGAGESVQVLDDTARAFALLSEAPRARGGDELWLCGDLRGGRDGVSFTLGTEAFGPRLHGRAFLLQLVRRLLQEHSVYDVDAFRIDASSVRFGPEYERDGREVGIVKHLRLIALYERWIRGAIEAFRGARRLALRGRGGFRRATGREP